MSAKANSVTDDESTHGVTIAAEAYDANTPEQMLTGTEHILVDGEPLCGNRHVKDHVESGRYGTEATRHPLNGYDTCKTCGRIYVSRYGSKHETFEEFADFEKGDWVSLTTEDGETKTGRVYHTTERTKFPTRRITIVLSDEPQDRWIYGVEEKIKVRVSEGEQPVIAHGSILDDDYSEEPVAEIDTTTAPVDNVDERTSATLDDLEEIAGSRTKTVMLLGGDRHLFHLNARGSLTTQDLWELLDEFYKAGYEIKCATPGEERSGTDSTAITLIAKPLKSALATDGGTEQVGWFDALGSPVPEEQRLAGIREARRMGAEVSEPWINEVAGLVEQDLPKEAIERTRDHLDLTGTYRFLAALCVSRNDEPKIGQ